MDLLNKKILLVIHQGRLGGAERQGLGISKILTEKYNCQVYLLLTYSGETSEEFSKFSKDCHIYKTLHFGHPYLIFKKEFSLYNIKRLKWSIQYLLRLRKGIKPYDIDIIIPFLNFPSKVSYFLYKMLPSVQITFWHQLGLDSLSEDYFEKTAVNNIPFVIANSSDGLDMFQYKYNIDPKKLNVLPQYISLEYVRGNKENIKRSLGIPINSIVIGMIAHYRPEKLHGLLLSCIQDLQKTEDRIYLIFLGNKNNTSITLNKYEQLNRQIIQENLSKNIKLLSDVAVEDVLNILDIGVLVSEIEGVPNAVMEYMLYSLPVVATNHIGCRVLLEDDEFLINNNKKDLISTLEKLIADEELRKIIGLKNKELIKKYNMESYVDNLLIIFNKYV